jgi:alpha-L-rhamnosidase
VYGEIKVKWEIQDGKNMILQVNVPANSLAVISLINVSQDCIQELKNDVIKMGYSDVQLYEEEKRLAFTAASGQIIIKYKLNNVCGLKNHKLQV